MALGEGPTGFDAAIFAVLYATASYGIPLVRWLGLASAPIGAGVIAVLQVVLYPASGGASSTFLSLEVPASVFAAITTFMTFLIAFALAWTLGSLARSWRASRDARRAAADAQREIVVQQERNRIARDLHDVVAHSLAVVIAQADGARYAKDPAAKDASLATISATSREALGDVRLLLARLRHEEGAEPQPALADLDGLIEQVRVRPRGEPRSNRRATRAGAGPAARRLPHRAGGAHERAPPGDHARPVVVRLSWRTTGLDVEVRNSAAGAPQGEGHGLPGMRERATLAGGELTAGPYEDQWVVRARAGGGARHDPRGDRGRSGAVPRRHRHAGVVAGRPRVRR